MMMIMVYVYCVMGFFLSHSTDMQCNCAMGLMPAIKRAWFTVDCTVYMWNYEDGSVNPRGEIHDETCVM